MTTPRLTAILALSQDGALGSTTAPGGMPWTRLPRDLRNFRRLTDGKVCLVGRRTYDTLPRLPGRRLAVLTRTGASTHVPAAPGHLPVPGVTLYL